MISQSYTYDVYERPDGEMRMLVSGYSIDIYCDNCRDEDEIGGVETRGACLRQLRAMGWSVGRKYHLCPTCAKNKKKSLQNIEDNGTYRERLEEAEEYEDD